jgi:lysine/ornithine N-monooxygenase
MLSADVDDIGRIADAAAGTHLRIDVCDAHPKMRATLGLDQVVLATGPRAGLPDRITCY